MAAGAVYEIRNAQNYFGAPVLTGVYAGSPIAVPMPGASSGEIFNAFVVRTTSPGSGNLAPTVAITTPANNASFTAPATIAITASAADSDGTVTKVDFYQGATLLGTDTAAPYSFAWNNVTGAEVVTAPALSVALHTSE